ncbi:MAG: hypothetical protein ACJ8HI_19305 [Massilia sp.]
MLEECVLDDSGFVGFSWDGPKGPPSAPPAIPPIIINPFSYHSPAPAIDPRRAPLGPPCIPPPCPRQRL